MIYIDFVEMPKYDNPDFILVASCSLSSFTQAYATRREIDSEGAIKLLWENWFKNFGLPGYVQSDVEYLLTVKTILTSIKEMPKSC